MPTVLQIRDLDALSRNVLDPITKKTQEKKKKMWCLLCLQQHQAEIWGGAERCLRSFRKAKAKNKPLLHKQALC